MSDQPSQSHRVRRRAPFVRFLHNTGRLFALAWVLCGLLVCSETLPDVSGHAHLHQSSHQLEPWHDGNGDASSPASNPTGNFHYHVLHDYSSSEVDVCGQGAPDLAESATHAGVRRGREIVPASPSFGPLKPPLI